MSKQFDITLCVEHVQRGQYIDSNFIYDKNEDSIDDVVSVFMEECDLPCEETSDALTPYVDVTLGNMLREGLDLHNLNAEPEGETTLPSRHVWLSAGKEAHLSLKIEWAED